MATLSLRGVANCSLGEELSANDTSSTPARPLPSRTRLEGSGTGLGSLRSEDLAGGETIAVQNGKVDIAGSIGEVTVRVPTEKGICCPYSMEKMVPTVTEVESKFTIPKSVRQSDRSKQRR